MNIAWSKCLGPGHNRQLQRLQPYPGRIAQIFRCVSHSESQAGPQARPHQGITELISGTSTTIVNVGVLSMSACQFAHMGYFFKRLKEEFRGYLNMNKLTARFCLVAANCLLFASFSLAQNPQFQDFFDQACANSASGSQFDARCNDPADGSNLSGGSES